MDINAIFYPSLLICGLLGIALLVILGSTIYWMRHADGEYRQCPECGKQGTGYIVDTNLLDSQSHVDHKSGSGKLIILETFEDRYQCEECNHEWTAVFEKATRKSVN